MIDDTTRFVRTAHKASVDLSTEGVVLDLDSGVYFALEGVGQRIWELLVSPRTAPELRDQLMEEYDVDEAAATADTNRFLEELLQHRLIERQV